MAIVHVRRDTIVTLAPYERENHELFALHVLDKDGRAHEITPVILLQFLELIKRKKITTGKVFDLIETHYPDQL